MHDRKTPIHRPRLPEEARKKLSSGGAHRNKKAHHRASLKRAFERQMDGRYG